MNVRTKYGAIEALNYSALKHILTSPAKYQAELKAVSSQEEELKYVVGTLVHAMILEGKDFQDLYAIKPKGMSFASKEGKAWKEAQILPILKEEDAEKIPRMAEAIANDPEASQLLAACSEREISLTGTIKDIPFKALLDAVGKNAFGPGFMDIKTTTDASPSAFAKKVRDLHYDLQAEIYSRLLVSSKGMKSRPWLAWIVVEDKEPYEVACYWPSEAILETGSMKLEFAIERYLACSASGSWPKALSGFKELSPAPFAREIVQRLAA